MHRAFSLDIIERYLVRRLQFNRSPGNFCRLYHYIHRSTFVLAMQLSGGDVVQTESLLTRAWVTAMESFSSCRPNMDFTVWFRELLVHCNSEDQRQQASFLKVDIDCAVMTSQILLNPRAHDAESILRLLPPPYRFVIVLRDLLDYSYTEIATLMGTGEGICNSYLCKARKMVGHTLVGQERRSNKDYLRQLFDTRMKFRLAYSRVPIPGQLKTTIAMHLVEKGLIKIKQPGMNRWKVQLSLLLRNLIPKWQYADRSDRQVPEAI